jgi:hypothetical protein
MDETMSTYHIAPEGVGFQVVETLPDGSEGKVIVGFLTEAAAREWIAEVLRLPDSSPRPHREA